MLCDLLALGFGVPLICELSVFCGLRSFADFGFLGWILEISTLLC